MSAIGSLLSNPFSLLVLIFATGLSVSSFTISGCATPLVHFTLLSADAFCDNRVQLAPLDKVIALLESVAMFYVAYPAAEATGKVLLQTAPPPEAVNMIALTRGLRDVCLLTSQSVKAF